MTERDIERWTREVAEDPGAPAFVRLARAYRAQGRRDAARDVVVRGLEHNPEHVGAHGLLALIHVEDGERQKAGDEWATVLRLDPDNFAASRGLGFLALEGGDLDAARRHLQTAARSRPDDPAVTQALQVLHRRETAEGPPTAAGRRPSGEAAEGAGPGAGASTRHAESARPRRTADVDRRSVDAPGQRDPTALFEPLAADAPFLGAVILDRQGLVLAGDIDLEGARGELLGALIDTAATEARRTTRLLGLGEWEGMLLHCEEATVHVGALPGRALGVLAARSGAPAGWAVRTAERARALAVAFLEGRP